MNDVIMRQEHIKDLPQDYRPSIEDANWFINYWNELPNYSNQERALDKLFLQLCPKNKSIEDILIKCSALNDFYSTNIFDIHTLAQHILGLNIDERLRDGDLSLVRDIANVEVNGKTLNFYSFATKYCSHHQPEVYAIYDRYVEKVLLSLNKREVFGNFQKNQLKDYDIYMRAIRDFQQYFGLTKLSIKQLDQYLWQLGKWYFNQYGLSFKYYNREPENPYPREDIKSHFWHGEMMFVTTHQSVGFWKNEGKTCLKEADEQIKSLAKRLTPEQFGVIIYISTLFGKWCPYDDQSWLIEY